jgi:deoxyribonucleoside regulator
MCGGVSNLKKNVYVSEITKVFVDMLKCSGYMMPFPAIVDSRQLKEEIDKENSMQEILGYADKINIAILTTGQIGMQCALARAGYLKKEEIELLKKRGAVGDVCTHVIDKNGVICDEDLDARTVAVPYEKIKKIETRIGVAVGEAKVESILGMLHGKVVNVFVTDENTVELIKELKPEIFE